ncbi:MAG TPA: type IV pili methyl-accepting chemotaxis transducer N-terminal domain-containing protein, partial [Burkholderiaceae bacterium]|nr:type IV pili methyl-accepting chemotaxis transducer N-terminal domain-containing protein [Burkholderiaceae bacterium]
MSLLEKVKVWGRGPKQDLDAEHASVFDEETVQTPGGDAANDPLPGSGGAATLDLGTAATLDTSIISESAPSEMAAEFGETRLQGDNPPSTLTTGLPVIGKRPVAEQQRVLLVLGALGAIGLAATIYTTVSSANRGATQVGASGQALMQSQRLAKSVSQALIGSPQAFPEVKEAADVLAKNVRGLKEGAPELGLQVAPAAVLPTIQPLLPLVDRAEKNANAVLAQQKTLTQVGQALRAINRQSSDLLETAETVSSLKLQQEASPAELSAVGQLVMLTQRIGKSANEFLTMEGVSPEAVFLLGKDLNSFREIAEGLTNGNPELRLPGTKDAQTKERLQTLLKQYEETRTQASAILGNLQGLVSAREAQAAIVADSEPLRKGLESVQEQLSRESGAGALGLLLMLLSAAALAASGAGFLLLYTRDQKQRAQAAEAQRVEAEREQQEAKRVNDANQAAILRLMNELQTVAEGDLTQQATVTE